MATKAIEEIKPELEIDEQLSLHKKGWVVQRMGWVLIVFMLPVLGALGLFGEGPLSQKKEIKGAYETEYERFYRYEKEMQVLISSPTSHVAEIALPQQYLKNFRVVRIIPEPEHRLAIGPNIVFQFGGNSNRLVTIYAVPQTYGSISGIMAINNQPITLHHYIFP